MTVSTTPSIVAGKLTEDQVDAIWKALVAHDGVSVSVRYSGGAHAAIREAFSAALLHKENDHG
jgi:hypothetical protein